MMTLRDAGGSWTQTPPVPGSLDDDNEPRILRRRCQVQRSLGDDDEPEILRRHSLVQKIIDDENEEPEILRQRC